MSSCVEQTSATTRRGLVGFSGLFVGSLVAGALALSGCGGNSGAVMNIAQTGASSGAGGSGGSSGTTVTGTGTSSGGSGATAGTGTIVAGSGMGTGSVMGAPPAVCMTYCTAIIAACTGNSSQFKDQDDCLEYCSLMPAGTGMPGDTSDSIGCRSSHLPAAGATATYLSCLQAGPDTVGACQDEHASFCNVAFSYCTAANGYTGPALYTDVATCQSIASLLPNNTENSPNT
jgi:hypothetical protein